MTHTEKKGTGKGRGTGKLKIRISIPTVVIQCVTVEPLQIL